MGVRGGLHFARNVNLPSPQPLSLGLGRRDGAAAGLAVCQHADKNYIIEIPWPAREDAMQLSEQKYEELKRQWIDQFVEVNADHPELKRFASLVGRVITVNRNGKAIVDFADGAWYDITASTDNLRVVDAAKAKDKYDGSVNSAQLIPEKQGA